MNTYAHLRLAENVHCRRFDSELIVLDLNAGQYYGLNEVAAEMLERIAKGESVPTVVTALAELYDVDRAQLEIDTQRTVTDLLERGLLQNTAASRP